ncbi:MAG: AraC family transcriptional regulator [Pseudomonadota bacterium]
MSLPVADSLERASPAGLPRHLVEGRAYTPNGLIKTVGLDEAASLKASLWRAELLDAATTADPNFISLIHHRGGGAVWDMAAPDERATTDVASVHSNVESRQEWRSDGVVSYAHFYLPTTFVSSVSETLFERDFDLDDLVYFRASRDHAMTSAMRAAGAALFDFEEPSHLMLDSFAMLFAEILLRRFSVHERHKELPDARPPTPAKIKRVVDFIETHLDQNLTLARLADVAAMSAFHFVRKFKQSTGLTPHAYVTARRVERAKDLIRQGRDCLAEIAFACGFANQAHFTTVFRKLMGVTPGQYRREVEG